LRGRPIGLKLGYNREVTLLQRSFDLGDVAWIGWHYLV